MTATGRSVKDHPGRTWRPRRGLERPFLYRSGVVLYYDPQEKGGMYYNPATDIYVDNAEFRDLTGENWKRRANFDTVADLWLLGKKRPQPGPDKKDKSKVTGPAPKRRNQVVREVVERGWGSGTHGGGKRTQNRRDRHRTKQDLRNH